MNVEDEKSCKHVFDILDVNRNGTLEVEEFSKATRALGLNPTQADIQEILKEYDTDNDGVLSFKEFMRLVRLVKVGNETTVEEVLEIYNRCFPGNDGYITDNELRNILMGQGEPLQEQEVEQILQHFDRDGTGRIHVETLVSGLMDKA
jgi:Ca2+-binding EF-hand superfamily protein